MGSSPASWRVYLFIASLSVVALALAVWGVSSQTMVDWKAVAVLTGLGVLGTNLREQEFGDQLELSFTTVVLVAAIVLAGPGGAVIVGYFSMLLDFRSGSLQSHLFNPAMTACLSGAGAGAYVAVGGEVPVASTIAPLGILTEVALPMLLGYLVSVAVNTLLIGCMVHLTSGGNVLKVAVNVVRSLGPGYLVHVVVALLLVLLWDRSVQRRAHRGAVAADAVGDQPQRGPAPQSHPHREHAHGGARGGHPQQHRSQRASG
jgi:hypothetical protein